MTLRVSWRYADAKTISKEDVPKKRKKVADARPQITTIFHAEISLANVLKARSNCGGTTVDCKKRRAFAFLMRRLRAVFAKSFSCHRAATCRFGWNGRDSDSWLTHREQVNDAEFSESFIGKILLKREITGVFESFDSYFGLKVVVDS